MSRVYDNWERLVGAVLDREELRDLARCSSLASGSDFSFRFDPTVEKNATGAAFLFARAFALYRRMKPRVRRMKPPDPVEEFREERLKIFSIHELQIASDNFSDKNNMGRYGFARFYRGRLADGSLVAVKRLRKHIQVGEHTLLEKISSRTVHRNLLQMIGFCITKRQMLLVYPYMANGSVASRVRDRRKSHPPLGWPIRKRIALGSARGLAYLHDNCDPEIIQRDVKASNILLDENFEAVVGDFALAKLMDYIDTHATTVRGTIGHIAPKYFSTGEIYLKRHVYGYGVILLELITGKPAFDGLMLFNWVQGLLSKKKLEILVDADLKGNYTYEEVEQLIQVALVCTQISPTERPKMSEVVRMLQGDGLAERWEEYQKEEMCRQQVNQLYSEVVEEQEPQVTTGHLGQLKRFSLQELQVASDNFSYKNRLGRGGFGGVYKGRLADGCLVAVKRVEEHTQGRELQFQTQVEMARTTGHRNVLQLLGFCTTETERLLVYPYMANGSVASCLRDRPISQPPLGWPIRKRIALGSARGLAYLHDKCDSKIILRDVKANNILLDEDFEAVVGDFRIVNDTRDTFFEEGSVYGYGVILLELISGKRSFSDDHVKTLFNEKRLEMLVDFDLRGNYIDEEVEQLFQVALLCTQSSWQRPNMSEVVRMLQGDGLAKSWQEFLHMGGL